MWGYAWCLHRGQKRVSGALHHSPQWWRAPLYSPLYSPEIESPTGLGTNRCQQAPVTLFSAPHRARVIGTHAATPSFFCGCLGSELRSWCLSKSSYTEPSSPDWEDFLVRDLRFCSFLHKTQCVLNILCEPRPGATLNCKNLIITMSLN